MSHKHPRFLAIISNNKWIRAGFLGNGAEVSKHCITCFLFVYFTDRLYWSALLSVHIFHHKVEMHHHQSNTYLYSGDTEHSQARSNHTGSATDWYYIFESTLRIRSTPVGLPDFVSPPDLILGKCVYLIWLCTTQLHIISNFISSLTETCLLLLNLFQLVRTFVNKKVTAGKRLEISILAQSVSPWAFKVW